MNFWERLQWAAWKVQAAFGNEDAAIHAQSLEDVTSEKTSEDAYINRVVNIQPVKGPRIPLFSDALDGLKGIVNGVGSAIKNVGGLANFVGKHLIPVLLLGLIIYAAFWFFFMRRSST